MVHCDCSRVLSALKSKGQTQDGPGLLHGDKPRSSKRIEALEKGLGEKEYWYQKTEQKLGIYGS